MVKICTCRDSAEAHLLVQELASFGYPAVIVGDQLEAALGDLPASGFGPEVHVPAESADRVREVVGRLRWKPGASEPPGWTCAACGERIEGRFTECWSCGGERGVAIVDDAGRAVMPDDVPCVGCGYGLTNLMPAGRCPECGTRIIESIVAPGR